MRCSFQGETYGEIRRRRILGAAGSIWIRSRIAAIFALIHGSLCYGTPAGLAFPLICLANAGIFEMASLRTGFPFGHYYFTAVMGPKIAGLPLLLALAYVGMAYLAWTLSRLILGIQNRGNAPNRSRLITPMPESGPAGDTFSALLAQAAGDCQGLA